ncbi:MAG: cytochrome c oxidase assembly protein [Chloroflexota bacterium]|nr:cytochrome c oxidase assembly protein [Chloroflexota bacterium]MDE2969926.1 cytochrome c oxidase assembly protein [Chloroflexota bacterium]
MTFWNTWTFDPLTLTGLAVLFLLYTRGLWRSRGRSGNLFPWWRPTSFYAGWTALLAGAASPIDGLSGELFLMHMVQHMLMMMVGPPLILVGAPVVPVLRGLPKLLRDDLAIPLLQMRRVRKVLSFLASPLTAWLAFVFTVWIWHIPALYNEAVTNEALHFLQHVMFTSAAVFFWWSVIDPVPLKPRLPYPLRLLYLFLATLQSTVLAAIITLSEEVLYTYYVSVPRLWGLTPGEDQMIAGLIMWIPGAGIYFTVLTVLFFVMLYKDDERMRRLEGRPVSGPRRW